MAVLVCCVSVGSRKVRLGKFWQGGLGKAGQRGASPDWVGIGMARLGGSGKEGYGKLRRGVAWRSWPCEFRLGETSRGVSRRSS